MKTKSVQRMTASALLIALGIVIPMFMPGFRLEPASFTLMSHVPVFVAMMISPGTAAMVAIGTTIGFFFSATPIIALRAASHLVFALLGAFYLQKHPEIFTSLPRIHLFSLFIALIHSACELVVVTAFYFGGSMGPGFYEAGFVRSVLLIMGIGSVVHSVVDFEVALVVQRVLSKQRGFAAIQAR